MEYKYYDPPLSRTKDERATISDIIKLEEESDLNDDLTLAWIDYKLHFGLSVHLDAHYIEGYDYRSETLRRGGSVAVYRECIKRNLNVDQLFENGLVLADQATRDDWDKFNVSGQRPIEKAHNMPHDECITYLKKLRGEALERQRKRQQS